MRATALLPRRARDLPSRVVTRSGVAVDRERLAAYDRVCGFALRDELPPTYPHLLAFPLALELMSDRDFPFSPLGLVHVGNRIEVLRPLDAGERLDLAVWAEGMSDHPRGRQFHVTAEASVEGAVVWAGRSTYLHRERSGSRRDHPDSDPPAASAIWTVPADLGRRYARISGDWNPIHLGSVPARLFGQRGTIAHGMWVKARCIAALSVRGACEVEVRFKRPLRVPGRAGFSRAGSAFEVWDLHSCAPCVTGKAQVGGEA